MASPRAGILLDALEDLVGAAERHRCPDTIDELGWLDAGAEGEDIYDAARRFESLGGWRDLRQEFGL